MLKRLCPQEKIPAQSTIARILERTGLVQPRRRRYRGQKSTSGRERVTPEGPNDLWTVDYKGWWRTRNGTRCEPLTLRDEWSRFVLDVRATRNNNTESAREIFEAAFSRYGLPKAIP